MDTLTEILRSGRVEATLQHNYYGVGPVLQWIVAVLCAGGLALVIFSWVWPELYWRQQDSFMKMLNSQKPTRFKVKKFVREKPFPERSSVRLKRNLKKKI